MNRPPPNPPGPFNETVDAAVDELENEFILRLPASLPVGTTRCCYFSKTDVLIKLFWFIVIIGMCRKPKANIEDWSYELERSVEYPFG